MTRSHACARVLSSALCASAVGLVAGCGSGVGTPSSFPQKPGTPVSQPVSQTQAPQLGYFWNPTDQTLRPILGIPGSSLVGASAVPAGTYVYGASSLTSALAVMIEPDGSLDVVTLPAGAPTHVNASVAKDTQIRFSPNGKTAVLFTPGSDSVLLLTDLGGTPASSMLHSATLQDAAVSDSGRVAVATANAVQILAATGAATQVGTFGSLGGLAFGAGDNLVYADGSSNVLTVIRNASTAPSPMQVPTTGLLKTPTALNVSPNGQWVLVANAGEQSTVRIDLTAQTAPLRIACSCTPVLVTPMSATGTFRVTAPANGPLWAVEATAAAPRSFFVPAVHP